MSAVENVGRPVHTSARIISERKALRYEHTTQRAWEKYGPTEQYDLIVRKLRARYDIGDARQTERDEDLD